jgi:rhodanese-related sulfurtransferase
MQEEPAEGGRFPHRQTAAAEMGGYRLVDAQSAHGMLLGGEALFVDVRDALLYRQGHLPSAVCFPLPMTWRARLQHRWKLRKLLCTAECRPVVFYTEGPSCRRSDVAARAAVITGFPAVYRFAGGVQAWVAAGLPLEAGTCPPPLRSFEEHGHDD